MRRSANPVRRSVGAVVPVTGTVLDDAVGDVPATGLLTGAGDGVGAGDAIVVPPVCAAIVTVDVSVSSVPPEFWPVTVNVYVPRAMSAVGVYDQLPEAFA